MTPTLTHIQKFRPTRRIASLTSKFSLAPEVGW